MSSFYSNFELMNDVSNDILDSLSLMQNEIRDCRDYIKDIDNRVIEELNNAESIERQINGRISAVQYEIEDAMSSEPPMLIVIPPLEAELIYLQGKKMQILSYKRKLENFHIELSDLISEFNKTQQPLLDEFEHIGQAGNTFIIEYKEELEIANNALYGYGNDRLENNSSQYDSNVKGSYGLYNEGHSNVKSQIEFGTNNTVFVNENKELENVIDSLLSSNNFFNADGSINSFNATQEPMVFNSSSGDYVYDNPDSTIRFMDCNQGKAIIKYGASGAEEDFYGTCGLESIVNVCRLSGKYINEQDVVLIAVDNFLCTFGTGCPSANGGTNYKEREGILKHIGIESQSYPQNVDDITTFVKNGHGVILSLDATTLYGINDGKIRPHACVPISVTIGSNGETKGFYICDSNQGMSKYYSVDLIKQALTPSKMNVTNGIIR